MIEDVNAERRSAAQTIAGCVNTDFVVRPYILESARKGGYRGQLPSDCC